MRAHGRRTGIGGSVSGRLLDLDLPSWVAVAQRHRDDGPLPELVPEEAELIEPRAVAARQVEVRLGRSAARAALEALGRPAVPILRGPHREPLWPEGVVGSITHADGLAVAALAPADRCAGLGIDLEHRDRHFDGLAEQVAHGDERAWLADHAPGSAADATVALFSAKEAIFKALYPLAGEYFGFEAAHLTPEASGSFSAELAAGAVPGVNLARPLVVHTRWHDQAVFSWLVVAHDDLRPAS